MSESARIMTTMRTETIKPKTAKPKKDPNTELMETRFQEFKENINDRIVCLVSDRVESAMRLYQLMLCVFALMVFTTVFLLGIHFVGSK